ncbi:MAG TPA: IS110 family transposase [Scandinavium sp.]|uniref:IS110 family transposase n=1 Tax=Scandinavium sp. TaxID=2830653 RepID=UPI002E33A1F2|nr:IS110 family transposase [Scandinavium sp.]HEX4500657.1 IS110 family transposase [Scandinavium sp.]
MHSINNTELSSHEGTRCQFNGGTADIKLGIDVHQDFYVVVMQEGGMNPKPPQRFGKQALLCWASKLKAHGREVHAVYEACGFGFSLQRQLSTVGVHCYVVCPQKLDEQNKRVKTDSLDAKALCLRLDRFVQGNRDALAMVRVPTEQEEQCRAIHRQREQLVKVRKVLEAQGRSLMVNHGLAPVQNWWKPRNFAGVALPAWIKELLQNSQPILVALQEKIQALTAQLENAVMTEQPRGLGKMTSVLIDREIGDWNRFNNRRQIASYTGLCPGEYSSGNTRLQSCVTKHGNPRLRAALVELAWRLVRFQPNYRAVRKWKERLAKGTLTTGAARKKAIVAVARQLAVDLWRVRTGRLTQEQLGLEILK